MEIQQALEDIDIVFGQLEFAIKLLSFCELGNIDPKEFDADHVVLLEGGNLHFPSGQFSDKDRLEHAANIFVLLAFSASVLVLDKAFEVVGIAPDPEAVDNVGRLRALIYMLRCAQAHGIADPHWEARGKYARTLTVDFDGSTILLDLQTLNGQRFHIDQLGGILTGIAFAMRLLRSFPVAHSSWVLPDGPDFR